MIGDINFSIPSMFTMFFNCILTTTECISIDLHTREDKMNHKAHQYLSFNLIIRICKKYRGVWITGTHLRAGALESWKEYRMKQSWFRVAQPRSNIACHPKIRVLLREAIWVIYFQKFPTYLVNGTWNETHNVFSSTKHVRKWVTKWWSSLDGGKRNFTCKQIQWLHS